MQQKLIAPPQEEKLRIVAQVIPIWKQKKHVKSESEQEAAQKEILPLFNNQRVFKTPKHDYL